MNPVPLRVDFAGGWLDCGKLSRIGGHIVNVAIQPFVTLEDWRYAKNSGLGGSAAFALLNGKDPFESEDALGVGWQDPAVIVETGLCCWASGNKPKLEMKRNPSMLEGRMALMWTGKPHNTPGLVDRPRDYEAIAHAGMVARFAVEDGDFTSLCQAVRESYFAQVHEGMELLPDCGSMAKKYCGGGHGGYALYLFSETEERDRAMNMIPIEPYMRQFNG